MSERGIELKLRINFPVILFTVVTIHALLMGVKNIDLLSQAMKNQSRDKNRNPLRIRDIRTVGSRESKTRNLIPQMLPKKGTPEVVKTNSEKKSLSFSDLQMNQTSIPNKLMRPGTRPEVAKTAIEKTKSLSAISLKGNEIHRFADAQSAANLSGDPRAAALQNSDILVNLEVPEGVNPDELNKYELMFYGFQRRTAIGYINSFYKNLDQFQRENPHLQFPMTDTKQVMTGRVTYDSKGNIVQIKMIRWSNQERLQDFFVEVLKDMDTLHNPPQALWEKSGEFSIFFSLVLNG